MITWRLIFTTDDFFEPSPLVGRLHENSIEDDSKFFTFPKFAIAPTTSVEKTDQRDQQLPQQQQQQQQQQRQNQFNSQQKPRRQQQQQQQQQKQQQVKQFKQQRPQQQQQQQQEQPNEEEDLSEFQPPWSFFPEDRGDAFYRNPQGQII